MTDDWRGVVTTRGWRHVWEQGPKAAKGWTWGPVLPATATRLHFVPLARLDEKLFAKVCPKPEGW